MYESARAMRPLLSEQDALVGVHACTQQCPKRRSVSVAAMQDTGGGWVGGSQITALHVRCPGPVWWFCHVSPDLVPGL